MKIKKLTMLAVTGFFLSFILMGCRGGSGALTGAGSDVGATVAGDSTTTGDITAGEITAISEGATTTAATPEGTMITTSGDAATTAGGSVATSGSVASSSQKGAGVSQDYGPKAAGTGCQSACLSRSPKDANIAIDIPLRELLKSMQSSEASMFLADRIYSVVGELDMVDTVCAFCRLKKGASQDVKTSGARTSASLMAAEQDSLAVRLLDSSQLKDLTSREKIPTLANFVASMLENIDGLCDDFGISVKGVSPEWFDLEKFRKDVKKDVKLVSEGMQNAYSISGYSKDIVMVMQGARFILATPTYFDDVFQMEDQQCPGALIEGRINLAGLELEDRLYTMFKVPPTTSRIDFTIGLDKYWTIFTKWWTGANQLFFDSFTRIDASYLRYEWLNTFKESTQRTTETTTILDKPTDKPKVLQPSPTLERGGDQGVPELQQRAPVVPSVPELQQRAPVGPVGR